VPKISPIILAALPIANNLDALRLFDYLKQILHGLIDHNISVISYACVVERSVQSLLMQSGDEKIEYSIPRLVTSCIRRKSCVIQTGKSEFKSSYRAGPTPISIKASKDLNLP
jgi:hypothetical protein